MTATSLTSGLICPVPFAADDRVQLGHGSGGKLSAALLRERFLPQLGNPALDALGDAAVIGVLGTELAISTDTFVVSPLEFPGGNIGSLAVHGTLNDLAMMGARPVCLTAGFVLEEGLPFDLLDRIIAALAGAARHVNVPVVTGDTKVVERGKADGMFINTTGIGLLHASARPAPQQARPGDAILVSGPIGQHGIAIMAAREGIGFETRIESDSATLWPMVQPMLDRLGAAVHVLRDPTRGGMASALNEIAQASGAGIAIDETSLPIPGAVAAGCEMLGLDPLYVANEGVCVAIVPGPAAAAALDCFHAHPLGREAAVIGRVVDSHAGFVILRTSLGGTRVVDMLPGDQLPRIC